MSAMSVSIAKDLQTAEQIASLVREAGGRAFYVGGFVRDALLGIGNKDVDIEIHGLPYETVKGILESVGSLKIMGASFGVFGLAGCGLDIALPRREKATGRGHKDFEIYVDPFIGPQKAAERRDFTVNALMRDVLTGEVLDLFGGREDLQNGILRHVNDDSFGEDPLRVLRAAQFAARFGFQVAEETAELCSRMDLTGLSRERVMGELEKALVKAEKPSVFFEFLRRTDQLDFWFPELEALIGVPQNPRFHPEGDVWRHTMLTLDTAAQLRSGAKQPTAFMLAALCHDLGKADTTEEIDGVLHAYGHETEGVETAKRFLARLTNESALKRYVADMTEKHMRPNVLAERGASHKSFMHLFDESVCPDDLLLLAKADYLGCLAADYTEKETVLQQKLAEYRELMRQPEVQGADLVAEGIRPCPEFHEALAYAHKLHLAGVGKQSALRQTLGYLRHLDVVPGSENDFVKKEEI